MRGGVSLPIPFSVSVTSVLDEFDMVRGEIFFGNSLSVADGSVCKRRRGLLHSNKGKVYCRRSVEMSNDGWIMELREKFSVFPFFVT